MEQRRLVCALEPVWQCTTIEPARTIYAKLAAAEAAPVVSLSFAEGFPASDIRDCGPAVIAYAEGGNTIWQSQFGLVVFCEILVFIATLLIGYAYAWKKGVFQWR